MKTILAIMLIALPTICWAKGTSSVRTTSACCVFKAPKAPKAIHVPKTPKPPSVKLAKAPRIPKVKVAKVPKPFKLPAYLKPTKVKAVHIPKLPKAPKTKAFVIVPAEVTSFSLTSGFNATVSKVVP